ncbi:MAG TPA: hypothetical protein VFB62_23910 [Polyangiaceae bacterium]|nr:hypothetical protein [Polyangiaceae bacterium]
MHRPLAFASCLLLAGSSHAQTPPADEMVGHMERYFAGELDEAAVFTGLGGGAAFVGGSLIANGSDMALGASIPLLAVSAIQLGAGIVLLVRTGDQVRDLRAKARKNLAAYRAEELPRMARVNFWFDVYKGIEIGLALLGVAGMAYGQADDRPAVFGAGIGLTSQSLAMLSLDLVAEDRADRYTSWILRLTPPTSAAPPGWSVEGRF